MNEIISFVTTHEKHLFTSDEKIKWWGYGEWVEEFDQVRFIYINIECYVRRIYVKEGENLEHVFGGFLCGYVKIPIDHPCYLKQYNDMDIECHGGLTFGKMDSDGHWIGFDCAHMNDICPSIVKKMVEKYENLLKAFDREEISIFHMSYKNIKFCINQCMSIVDQLIEIAKEKKYED